MFRRRYNPSTRTELAVLGLTKEEAAALTSRYSVIQINEGAPLCRQGRTGVELLFILEGTAVVRRSGEEIAKVSAGDVVGELSVLGAQVFQNADVVALTPMRAAVLNSREWRTVSQDAPSLLERVKRTAQTRYPQLASAG